MSQHAWILELRPGYEDEYQKRHDEVWPEVVSETRAAGIRNYSIFRHGLTLVGYFETDDLERSIRMLNDGEANRRWDEYMAPIMKVEVDPSTNFPFLLPLIWRMEE
ncbi:MAG: L-rhamnose mutarotase [Roseibium album]|uniref:L-rhamnose mutarotase n=1 Tax=Roseibium album TaxID=311410 RepID=A0A0M7B0E8_9HYPH|nr:L-rhamnose mutarotase [Roseibium album]MBG6147166.1 L-rhamnose mutarotase [Labrenzia sp. EL_142]MBG6159748.1 L-rhamnose mutarotase [Labrenzia sp. EL_162]MBG6165638.1 L-rhamnose mutarotase [Labrenzia sp. EL_195]MBG6176512.1 L-rhamnose mutarotase [Labrenzia sp. EL_132]MBG6198280.1 L-rhamnose mutarotase [Labrenzia sp. EL_159]MBG6201899.1 L-rhamnose mutarotase [Labrenzia sp. EL_13]MBG6210137.1 L-rhamnose mutarotase [Labrenzia sp. EL_126]MBG6231018.1 L-rhamnose mutarotase [Labrenzia sp. EL_20